MLNPVHDHQPKVKRTDSVLRIQFPWWSWTPSHVAETSLLLAVGAFFSILGASFFGPASEASHPSLLGAAICFGFAFVLGYVLLARWINRTVLRVSKDNVIVKNSPLPFPRPRRQRIPTRDLRQLFVREVRKTVAYSSGESTSYANVNTYAVQAILTNGDVVELLNVGRNYDAAADIEEAIEEFLGIEDLDVNVEA